MANEGYERSFVFHSGFAKSPEHYVRAFLILQKDMQNLFDYVEPANCNLKCFSFRIHELLLRACVEAEANCKAILRENQYVKFDKYGKVLSEARWNRDDYKLIEASHRLSFFEVRLPFWRGAKSHRKPFAAWGEGAQDALAWYDAYNATKHDRHDAFREAQFGHMIDAVAAVLVLLSAQFHRCDFLPVDDTLSGGHWEDYKTENKRMESAIGEYFRIKFPEWAKEECYDFDWKILKNEANPFQNFDYSKPDVH